MQAVPLASEAEHSGDARLDDAELVSGTGTFSAPRIAGILVLSVIPFWVIPISHVMSNPETATGFFHYELPYYVANGRSAFERGNGILYPNPYDPAPTAPSIYVHWLPWILGTLTAVLGFDPGDVILVFTFFASLAFAWATRELVLHRFSLRDGPQADGVDRVKTWDGECAEELPLVAQQECATSSGTQSSQRMFSSGNAAFLLAMWAGGLLTVAGTIFCVATGVPWFDSVLRFDPGNGLWFLNWGRNALFPTEAVYHTLTVLCWLAEIRRRKVSANIWLVLLATTHPWSGLELLLTINLWRGVQFLRSRDRSSLRSAVFSVSVLVLFLGYYKVWLPTFPQHAELQSVWELNWSVAWLSAGLAYLPVLVPAVLFLVSRIKSQSLNRTEQFFVCAVFVAAGLAFHDRLIKPVQPIHFTRGYVWMPLFLLALPLLLDWWRSAWQQSRGIAMVAVVAVVFLIADNAVFSVVHARRQSVRSEGFYLDQHERALYSALHQSSRAATKTLLSDSETLNYLMPTYANVRPWLGHHFNTPTYPRRKSAWEACFEGHRVRPHLIPDDVDMLVLRRTNDMAALKEDPTWTFVDLPNAEWQVWERTPSIGDVSRSDSFATH